MHFRNSTNDSDEGDELSDLNTIDNDRIESNAFWFIFAISDHSFEQQLASSSWLHPEQVWVQRTAYYK